VLKTSLESDLHDLIQYADTLRTALSVAQGFLKDNQIGKALRYMTTVENFSGYIRGFFDQYDSFLQSMDEKFGNNFAQSSKSARKMITEIATIQETFAV